jgi:hypothetical protein
MRSAISALSVPNVHAVIEGLSSLVSMAALSLSYVVETALVPVSLWMEGSLLRESRNGEFVKLLSTR